MKTTSEVSITHSCYRCYQLQVHQGKLFIMNILHLSTQNALLMHLVLSKLMICFNYVKEKTTSHNVGMNLNKLRRQSAVDYNILLAIMSKVVLSETVDSCDPLQKISTKLPKFFFQLNIITSELCQCT